MRKDIVSDLKGVVAVEPQALSGTNNLVGEIIDTQGYESLALFLATDAIAASNLDATLLVEESDDSGFSSSNEVADADLIGLESATAIADTDDKVVKAIGYVGSKRYVRVTVDVSANDGTDVVGVVGVLGHPLAAPVDNNS